MKLVILDRDGTINVDSDEFIKSPDEWIPLPGSLEAISRLNHAGWHVAIASNQSGLGRGLFDLASLNAIHAKMHKQLAAFGGRIDAVFYCPHSPDEGVFNALAAAGIDIGSITDLVHGSTVATNAVLERKGMIRSNAPQSVFITADGRAYDTGLRGEILHGSSH